MDIPTLRKEIDEIDSEILKLLAKRQEVVSQIGILKRKQGIAPRDDVRWQEVLVKQTKRAHKLQIPEEVVVEIWERIHDWSLEIEKSK